MDQTEVPADASTLIYLAKADAFEAAANCLGRLLVPPAVWREAVDDGARAGYADVPRIRLAEATGFVTRVTLSGEQQRRAGAIATDHRLGTGESEALAVAPEGRWVLVDDGRAARVAAAIGLVPISTLFLPVLGRRSRLLESAAASVLLRKLAVVMNARAETVYEIERVLAEVKE